MHTNMRDRRVEPCELRFAPGAEVLKVVEHSGIDADEAVSWWSPRASSASVMIRWVGGSPLLRTRDERWASWIGRPRSACAATDSSFHGCSPALPVRRIRGAPRHRTRSATDRHPDRVASLSAVSIPHPAAFCEDGHDPDQCTRRTGPRSGTRCCCVRNAHVLRSDRPREAGVVGEAAASKSAAWSQHVGCGGFAAAGRFAGRAGEFRVHVEQESQQKIETGAMRLATRAGRFGRGSLEAAGAGRSRVERESNGCLSPIRYGCCGEHVQPLGRCASERVPTGHSTGGCAAGIGRSMLGDPIPHARGERLARVRYHRGVLG